MQIKPQKIRLSLKIIIYWLAFVLILKIKISHLLLIIKYGFHLIKFARKDNQDKITIRDDIE